MHLRILFVGLVMVLASGPRVDHASDKADPKEAILRRFQGEFIALTPGAGKFPASFHMGSTGEAPSHEKPAHTVTFSKPFDLARYEMTQELYEAVIGTNPSKWKGPRNSVEMVSWEEAAEFCRRATTEMRRRHLLGETELIRLPSEAEWEYACRAGSTTLYSFGDKAGDLKDFAWFKDNSKGEDPPVGKKKPNAWGLCDMHGYVWEWCQDAWVAGYDDAPADGRPRTSKDAKERVVRGGSWADGADKCRSAYRQHHSFEHRSDTVGFRCVRAAEEKAR